MLELRRCEKGNGLECWRVLCQRYDQATTSRLAAMLQAILRPVPFAQDSVGFETAIKDWELLVAKWETMASDVLNDAVKRQILQEQAPTAIRLQVMMQGHVAYGDMRRAVLSYVVTARDWSAPQLTQPQHKNTKQHGSDPMDVDAITWKGGKGKDKSKGKGKQQTKDKETRECWVCGKTGHLSSACWLNTDSGKGKSTGKKGTKGGGKHKTVSEVESATSSSLVISERCAGAAAAPAAARPCLDTRGRSGLGRGRAGDRWLDREHRVHDSTMPKAPAQDVGRHREHGLGSHVRAGLESAYWVSGWCYSKSLSSGIRNRHKANHHASGTPRAHPD